MSAVGKVIKSVWKAVKKVAPIVLGAAAVVFTAGAAIPAVGALLGSVGLGGGLAGVASSITGALGLAEGGFLATTLGGAITGAAYGSAIGGIKSAITGGNILEGMQGGALTGAITGGVLSGGSHLLNGAGSAAGGAPATGAPGAAAPAGLPAPSAGIGPVPVDPGAYITPQPIQVANIAAKTGAAAGAGGGSGAGGGGVFSNILGEGGWVERNPYIAGSLLSGIGEGLAPNEGLERDEAARRATAANYALPEGGLFGNVESAAPASATASPSTVASAGVASPTSAFNLDQRWVYDPDVRRLVLRPKASPSEPVGSPYFEPATTLNS